MPTEPLSRPWNGAWQFRRVPLPRPIMGQSTVLRPYLNVTLTNGEKSFETLALIDTGADFNMLPREVAEVLGIDVDNAPVPEYPCSGVAAGGRAKVFDLDLVIYGHDHPLSFRQSFAVIVNAGQGQSKETLIGRHPLFHDFDFGFRMGFTNDPEIGKFTMRMVTKRRDASHYKQYGPLPSPGSLSAAGKQEGAGPIKRRRPANGT